MKHLRNLNSEEAAAEEFDEITIRIPRGKYNEVTRMLLKLIGILKYCGDVGTGRSIEVEGFDKLYIDGDGADKIESVLLNGKEAEIDEVEDKM